MCIWVDADSCPVRVRQHVAETAERISVKAVFVANRKILSDGEQNQFVQLKICDSGKDVADNFIFDSAEKNDIIITRDILFAERLVRADFTVMNDRGVLFSNRNIEKYVSERNLSLSISMLGLKKGFSKNSYGEKEFSLFCQCFDKIVAEKISQAPCKSE